MKLPENGWNWKGLGTNTSVMVLAAECVYLGGRRCEESPERQKGCEIEA